MYLRLPFYFGSNILYISNSVLFWCVKKFKAKLTREIYKYNSIYYENSLKLITQSIVNILFNLFELYSTYQRKSKAWAIMVLKCEN